MARSVARGKALVAVLRANPEVRDAEALAAWIGRVKKLRKAGMSPSKAIVAANKSGGTPGKNGSKKSRSPLADLAAEDDFGDNAEKSKEDRQRERYEVALIRQMEKEERNTLYRAIQEAGGIKTRDDLREEYREIPNTFKRRDGMPGDEMADYLAMYYPELGIESENDLLDFFAA